ncbi:MAG: DUF2505 family protein [Myxococcota bacterium]|mgnify:CR=1 FL=1
MKFTMTHVFEVDRETFERWLNDPELLAMAKAIPNLACRDLVSYREDGRLRIWVFRNVAIGEIPAAARALVKSGMLTWNEESTWDPDAHAFTWRIVPEHFAHLLDAHGTWSLHDQGVRTRRVIDGDLRVKVPLVGRLVEEFIVGRVKQSFEAEADLQRRFYASKRAGA